MKKGAGPLLLFLVLAPSACRNEEAPQREPPPPAASVRPHACAGGGGELKDTDAAKAFPRTSQGFCVDPNDNEKTYGEGAKEALELICDLFDGECETDKGF